MEEPRDQFMASRIQESSTIAEIPAILPSVEVLRLVKKPSIAIDVNLHLICKLKDKQTESI
jgi:hypothetical protein